MHRRRGEPAEVDRRARSAQAASARPAAQGGGDRPAARADRPLSPRAGRFPALLLAGAPLVHRAAPARQHRLQPAHPAAGARPPAAGDPGAHLRRDRAPSRDPADHLYRGRRGRPTGAGDRGAGAGAAAAGRPLGPAAGPPGGHGASPGGGGGRAAVRPRARAAAAAGAPPSRRRGPRPPRHHAPHCLRRLVERHPRPRGGRALRRLLPRPPFASAGAADPVCRLRLLAAPDAPGSGAREGARLLAPAARGRPAGSRDPDRPAAPAGRRLRGRDRRHSARRGRRRRGAGQGARPRRGGDALHAGPRGVPGPPRALYRADRRHRRHAGRQPPAHRDRGPDRILRQQRRAAQRPRGRPPVPRGPRPRPPGRHGGVQPPGPAVRQAGRGAQSRPQPRPLAVLPGHLLGDQSAQRRAGDPRPPVQPGRQRPEHRDLRPQPLGDRGPRRARRPARVPRRPVRRDDRAAPARTPGDAAARRRRRPWPPALRPAAPHRAGAAGAGGLE